MATQDIYIGSDHTVALTGMAVGATYLNAATVSYALTEADGDAVSGGTGTLSYVAASNGNYTGTIESTVADLLTENALYNLTITFAESPYNRKFRLRLRALYDEGA